MTAWRDGSRRRLRDGNWYWKWWCDENGAPFIVAPHNAFRLSFILAPHAVKTETDMEPQIWIRVWDAFYIGSPILFSYAFYIGHSTHRVNWWYKETEKESVRQRADMRIPETVRWPADGRRQREREDGKWNDVVFSPIQKTEFWYNNVWKDKSREGRRDIKRLK